MYHSRHRFTNGVITIALDTKSGSILELMNENNGDNIIKNHRHIMPDTFELLTTEGKRLTVPKAEAIYKNPSLMAKIEEAKDGVSVTYDCLSHGEETIDISLKYTIKLNGNKILWDISFDNNSDTEITICKFPYLCGIWLGESYMDDTLVYPYNAGVKLPNPVEYLSMPRNQIGWRWQDYKYTYNIDGLGLYPDNRGVYTLGSKYSGPLSMSFCDLYDNDGGVYIASHSGGAGIVSIQAESLGKQSAGVNLAVSNEIRVSKGERFRYSDAVVAMHDGSWHSGADIYREARQSKSDKNAYKEITNASWFSENPGLFAHYDFKYQNGGIVHRYSDIPKLAEQAKNVGLKHLLFAGWHKDGFDYGFPLYEVDKDLGSFEELSEGINYAHKLGVKVSFYINSRLSNTKYHELDSLIKDGAVVKSYSSEGEKELSTERYGNLDLRFAVMCANAPAWKKKMADAFDYVKSVGADGIYFDQIGMAPPCFCYNHEHGHKPNEWNKGCTELLELALERGLTPIIEGCSDIYGYMAAGQLVSTFSYIACAFPELYRYTFPEQTLVDMVYPSRNMAMRPTFVGDRWKQMIDDNFICGNYFWVYDLEEDNSFTNDKEAYEYLKEVVATRKKWLSAYGHGTFLDDKYLSNNGNIKAKLFSEPDIIAFTCNQKGTLVLERDFDIEEIILANGNKTDILKNGKEISFLSPALGIIKIKYSK